MSQQRTTYSFTKGQIILGAVAFAAIGIFGFKSFGNLAETAVLATPAHATPPFVNSRVNGTITNCWACHNVDPTTQGYKFQRDNLTSCGKGFYDNRNQM